MVIYRHKTVCPPHDGRLLPADIGRADDVHTFCFAAEASIEKNENLGCGFSVVGKRSGAFGFYLTGQKCGGFEKRN
jgi:hypothetical protein